MNPVIANIAMKFMEAEPRYTGVNMSLHNRKQWAKNQVRNRIARASRKVNLR
jgi:hypothetical protein